MRHLVIQIIAFIRGRVYQIKIDREENSVIKQQTVNALRASERELLNIKQPYYKCSITNVALQMLKLHYIEWYLAEKRIQ